MDGRAGSSLTERARNGLLHDIRPPFPRCQRTGGVHHVGKVRKAANARFPCIFVGTTIRPTDDRIQAAWKARFGVGAPFGSIRQTWRQQHCRTINPYGSDGCPFTIDQCIQAFEDAVVESLGRTVLDPRVYLISVAKSRGLDRAENKPATGPRITSTATEGPGVAGAVGGSGLEGRPGDLPPHWSTRDRLRPLDEGDGSHLRSRLSRPVHIGTLLPTADRRPRQGPDEDRGADREAQADPGSE